MLDKKISPVTVIAVSVLVSSLFAALFGFTAGYIAGNPAWTATLLGSLPPVVRRALTPPLGEPQPEQYTLPQLRAAIKPPPTSEQAAIEAVKRASPAVVSIVISKNVPVFEQINSNPFGGNDFFRQFFGDLGFQFGTPQYRQNGTEKQEVGAGTGFLVSEDGYIVTNRHVVADESAEYVVIMADDTKHDAQVVGRDSVNDIAVLKITGEKLPFIVMGDSDNLDVGQSVIAIGFALGRYGNSVSAGIISGLQRSITASDGSGAAENLFDVIQTDAAINPGNSGGPLLNLKGEVIGVNVATELGGQSIGFALPVSDVKKVVESVRTTGKISRPFLGVRYVIVTAELKKANQLPVDYGALVARGQNSSELAVMPGSPADVAGIVENDIILEIDGKKITADYPPQAAMSKLSVGDTLKLKLLHKGEEKTVDVVLAERQAE